MAEPVSALSVSVEINGEQVELEVPARRLLVHFLRDDLGLTGTHVGCDTGNCGACTVHLNGEPVKSCMLLAVQVDGARLATMTYSLAGDDIIIIDHTDVDASLRGTGAGQALVAAAVAWARDSARKILPLCPFAKSVFDKTPDYADVRS